MVRKTRTAGKLLLCLTIALAFGYGFYGLITYAAPLSKDNFRQAMTSAVADETEVLLAGAALAYEKGRYPEAVKVLELSIEKLVDRTGRYRAVDKWKLERVYFLLGKTYHRLEKMDKAVQNYEDTLRLNPNHLPAKYNLEQVQASGGQGGGGGAQPDKGEPKTKI